MDIIVLGGAGAIGSNIARHFNELGKEVIVFDNLTRNGVHNNLADFKRRGIEFIHGDIRCREDFLRLPSKHTPRKLVIDCAAQPTAVDGYNYPRYDYTNNTDGLFNTLEYVRESEALGFIFFSTNKVYSADEINVQTRELDTRFKIDPEADYAMVDDGLHWKYGFSERVTLSGGEKSLYGATKAASDMLVREFCTAYHIPHFVDRFSCMAGPNQWGKPEQGWCSWWMIAAVLGLPVEYIGWRGKQVRDILFTPDVCSLMEKQCDALVQKKSGLYNVGGGYENTLSLLEATEIVQEISGNTLNVSYNDTVRKADHCVYISDIRKVSKDFDWKPTVSMRDGYEQIHQWVLQNRTVLEGMYK